MITRNSDKPNKYSRFDYLLFMFSPEDTKLIVRITNVQFKKRSIRATIIEEILKLFSVCVLSTRFEFGSRASLWSNTASSKYFPAPAVSETGLLRNRFHHIWRHTRFSDQRDTLQKNSAVN